LAINNTWFDKQTNQRKEEVTFVEVTLWGRTAEIAGEYLAKGRQVLIEGRLRLDQWDDKQTGQKRSKLHVVCEDMRMLGSRGEGGGGGSSRGPGGSSGPQGDSGGFEPQDHQESELGSGSFEPPSSGGGDGEVPF
jgi:single-strand DNA-binding protein